MGNIFGIDMSGFSYKVLAAMAYAVGAMFAFALFPTFNGGAQSVHLEARAEGSCVTSAGQRFDRIVPLASATGASIFSGKAGEYTDPNKYDWSKASTVSQDGTGCQVVAANGISDASSYTANKGLTADGTEVGIVSSDAGAIAAAMDLAAGNSWEKSASMFNDNRDITNVVLGAIALVIGVGPIVVLGSIGMALLNTFGGSMGGAMKFLIATLGAVIAITLMGTIVDFISIAYDTVDRNRYTMYGSSVASLAGTIRQFWGLIFLASWVGLGGYYGWQGFQSIRGNKSAANPM